MNKAIEWVRWFVIAAGGFATALLGGWDTMLRVLALFVVLDYVTGLIAAWAQKKLSSKVGAAGIVRKVLIFAVVMVAAQLDVLIASATSGIPQLSAVPALCRSLVICFYIANEALSILENAGEAGLPIPESLKNALAALRKKGDEGAEVSDPGH